MRNAKCSICNYVRSGEDALRHCPACGARSVFAVATSEPVTPLKEQHDEREHGSLFYPSDESCLNSD